MHIKQVLMAKTFSAEDPKEPEGWAEHPRVISFTARHPWRSSKITCVYLCVYQCLCETKPQSSPGCFPLHNPQNLTLKRKKTNKSWI